MLLLLDLQQKKWDFDNEFEKQTTKVFHAFMPSMHYALRDEMEIDCESCGTKRKTDPVIDISRFDIIY